MLSNNAWRNVDDIQTDVERRLVENKVPKTNPLPLARYFHVADTVFTHGAESVKKNELDRAYYFHYFYVNLVVKVLPKHPKYDANLDMCLEAKKKCVTLLDTLGPLKEKLKVLYEEQRIRTATTVHQSHSNGNVAPAIYDELGLPSVPTSEPGEDGSVVSVSSAPTSALSNTISMPHNHTNHSHKHSHANHAHPHSHGGSVVAPLPELKLPLLTALTELPKNVQYQETQCCATIYPTGRMIRANLTIPKSRAEPFVVGLGFPSLASQTIAPVMAHTALAVAHTLTAPVTVPTTSLGVTQQVVARSVPARVGTPPPSFTGDSPHTSPVPASITSSATSSSTSPTASASASCATSAPTAQHQSVSVSSSVTSTSSSVSTPVSGVAPVSGTAHFTTSNASPAVARADVGASMPSTTRSVATPATTTSGTASAMTGAPTTPAPLPMPSALASPLSTNIAKRPTAAAGTGAAPVINIPHAIRKPRRLAAEGLRPMVLFAPMFVDFMAAAERNTRYAVETCGILAGVESDDGTIFITHLIIPKQIGKSDSVVTTHEEEVFMFQEQHGLLTFGWIHLFMSSVDLHTHFSYQSMMREAIAIVIAPLRSPNFGIFRLTEPDGMQEIGSCQDRGFHPHSGRETLYKVCEHTQLEWGDQHRSRYKVVDQRNG